MKFLVLPVLCSLLIGCGGGVPVEPEKPSQNRFVGQVVSIHTNQGFILFRRTPGVRIPTGSILISRGPGNRLANLRVSGEALGQMMAADIQSGAPEVGDSVLKPMIQEAGETTNSEDFEPASSP